MKTLNLLLVLWLISILPAVAQNPGDALPMDPDTKVGKLENGLTYYIRHNEYPKNQCCFYIAQRVGSMQEEENQRGLAHLLEHMAFNGTEHFPGGRLIKFLEENGIKFGAELNAYTSLEETVYNIDAVPTNKGEFLLDSCLQILADWSGGVSLLDEEIDKERGVVKSEYLMRNSAGQRMMDSVLPVIMSGTKYAYRMPIGLMSVVEGCPYDDLRAYYKKWYHPSCQGVIIVGDIDVDKMEQKVKSLFSKYTNPDNYAPLLPTFVPDNNEPIFASAKDKEQRNTEINLWFKYDPFPREQRNSYAYFMDNCFVNLCSYMSYNRLSELAKKADSPFLEAYCAPSSFVYASTKDAFYVYAKAKPGRELEAYKTMLREALRIAKFGFSQEEFDRAKAEMLSESESTYQERDKQENSYYVNLYVSNFTDQQPMMSIDDNYNLTTKCLDIINLDMVNTFLAKVITNDGRNMAVYNFSPEADGQFYFTNDIYKAATKEVFSEDIQPLLQKKNTKPLIKKLPKAGKIVSVANDALTGARILTLSNGVKVYTLKTDYKDDEILMSAHSWGGKSLYDAQEECNLRYMGYVMDNVGLGKYTNTDLQKYLAGRNVDISPSVGALSESISGHTVNKDLDALMELIYCTFTLPGSSNEDFLSIQQKIRQSIATANLDPRSTLSDSISAIRYNHNPRSMKLTVEDVDRMDFKRIQSIYKERFANPADFAFFFIGSFDEARLDSLVCKYIASMPAKGKPESFRKHTNDFNTNYVFCCAEREMNTPESRIIKYYTRQDLDYTLENQIKFRLISEMLDNRYFKTIREEASIAYHSGCNLYFEPNEETGKADVTLVAQNPLKAEYANVANQMMDSILAVTADKGFTEDELNEQRAFFIKNHIENQRTNIYWFLVMQRHFIYNSDFVTDYEKIINSFTVDDLQKTLKNFVDKSFTHTYILLPEGIEQVDHL